MVHQSETNTSSEVIYYYWIIQHNHIPEFSSQVSNWNRRYVSKTRPVPSLPSSDDVALYQSLHLCLTRNHTCSTEARKCSHRSGNQNVRQHGAGPVDNIAHESRQDHLWQVECAVECCQVRAHTSSWRRHAIPSVVEIQLQRQHLFDIDYVRFYIPLNIKTGHFRDVLPS